MSVRLQNGVFWFRFRINGIEIKRSTKQSNRQEALRQEADFRVKYMAGGIEKADTRKVATLSAFTPRFMEFSRSQRNAQESTLAFYQRMLDMLNSELGDVSLCNINARVFGAYVAKRVKSEHQRGRFTSVRRERQVLVTLLRYACAIGVIQAVPILFNPGKGERPRKFIPTAEQFAAYLHEASPLLRDAAILMASCGLRPGEICALTPQQVTPVVDGFVIELLHSKSDAGRKPIYLNLSNARAACSVLSQRRMLPQMFPTTVMALGKLHAKVRARLGLPAEFVIYSLRHLYVTRAGATMGPHQLRELARHADLKTTMIYFNPTEEDRRGSAASVNLLVPVTSQA